MPLALLIIFSLPADFAAASPREEHPYERGVSFVTDGAIPDGPCMRVYGHLTSPDFFVGLKRIGTANGFEFHRGKESVTQFPAEMLLQFQIRDTFCPGLALGDSRKYLTPEQVNPLVLNLYWKRGFALRRVEKAAPVSASVRKVETPAQLQKQGTVLPDRFVWNYEFTVRSAGVPLTDHLILVIRTPGGKLVARVSARM